ncbi:hypothetical protein [Streptomyces sp. NPDC048436]|uniref:hypothetical protein n=1 Tax=Streptomyces sp. NPDC048436 TaxID=3365550 RepID=UPI003720C464
MPGESVWVGLRRPTYLGSSAPWRGVAYLAGGVLLGIAVLIGGLAAALAVVLIGLPLLALLIFTGIPIAALERRRTLTVTSPPGGPTVLSVEIPCRAQHRNRAQP